MTCFNLKCSLITFSTLLFIFVIALSVSQAFEVVPHADANTGQLQSLQFQGDTKLKLIFTFQLPVFAANPELPDVDITSGQLSPYVTKVSNANVLPLTCDQTGEEELIICTLDYTDNDFSFVLHLDRFYFQTYLSIQVQNYLDVGQIFFDYSSPHVFVPGPFPTNFLYPVLIFDEENDAFTLSFHKLPNISNDWCVHIRLHSSMISNVQFSRTLSFEPDGQFVVQWGLLEEHFLLCFDRSLESLPTNFSIRGSFDKATQSVIVGVNVVDENRWSEELAKNQSFGVEFVAPLITTTTTTPTGLPRITLTSIEQTTTPDPSSNSWFKWSLSILTSTNDNECITYSQPFHHPLGSRLLYCVIPEGQPASPTLGLSGLQTSQRITLSFDTIPDPPVSIAIECYGTVSPFAARVWNNDRTQSPFITDFQIGVGDESSGLCNSQPHELSQLPLVIPLLQESNRVSPQVHIVNAVSTFQQFQFAATLPGYLNYFSLSISVPERAILNSPGTLQAVTSVSLSYKSVGIGEDSVTQTVDNLSVVESVADAKKLYSTDIISTPQNDLEITFTVAIPIERTGTSHQVQLQITRYQQFAKSGNPTYPLQTINLNFPFDLAPPTFAYIPLTPQTTYSFLPWTQQDTGSVPPTADMSSVNLATSSSKLFFTFKSTQTTTFSVDYIVYSSSGYTTVPAESAGSTESPFIYTYPFSPKKDDIFRVLLKIEQSLPSHNSVSYYLSQEFVIREGCFDLPNTYNDIIIANAWANLCTNGGSCVAPDQLNAACQCADFYTGEFCAETTPFTKFKQTERTLRFKWDPAPGSEITTFYRLGLGENATPSFEDVEWLTISYAISSEYYSAQYGSSEQVKNVLFVPDFIKEMVVHIPPRPTFTDYSIYVFQGTSGTVVGSYKLTQTIPAICQGGDSGQSQCTTCTLLNPYSQTGCAPVLDPAKVVGKCVELQCPVFTTVDFATCSCQCTSETCFKNTRASMVYFNTYTPTTEMVNRWRSFVYRDLQCELGVHLGLNTLPERSSSALAVAPLRGYIDSESSSFAPPVGYETVTILPMSYLDPISPQFTVYITVIKAFASEFAQQSTYKSKFDARMNFLSTKLASFNSALSSRTLFSTLSRNTTIKFNNAAYNWELFSLTSPPSSQTAFVPAKLTTRCVDTSPYRSGVTSFFCPTGLNGNSPFWSTCASSSKSLTVECVDLAGRTYPASPINSWCSSSALYPGFPKATSIPCGTSGTNYQAPTLSDFTTSVSPAAQLVVGTPVTVTWSYPLATPAPTSGANPTFSVDLFVAKRSPGTFLVMDDNDAHGDTQFTPQQQLDSGHRILLGTFPATSLTATATIPFNLVEAATTVHLSIRVTQAAHVAPLLSAPFDINPKNFCLDSSIQCGSNSSCKLTPTSWGCECDDGYVYDPTSWSCKLPCADSCGLNGLCTITGCTCAPPFTGVNCNIDLTCSQQNKDLCQDHGSVVFSNNQCGDKCMCTGNWAHNTTTTPIASNCASCTLIDFATNTKCYQFGTNSTRTVHRGCTKCQCNYGYSGGRCTIRSLLGTVFFQTSDPFQLLQSDIAALADTKIDLDDDIKAILIRDMALSLSIPIINVSIRQVLQTQSPPPSPLAVQQSGSYTAVTFEIQEDYNTNMDTLYDLWAGLGNKSGTTAIENSDSQSTIGLPVGVPDAFDPQCDPSITPNCPNGQNMLQDEDLDELIPPVEESGNDTTSLIIVIVVPIASAVVVIIIVVVVVCCCRKHQKGCFAPKASRSTNPPKPKKSKSNSNSADQLELVAETQTKTSTPMTFSSGTSTSVDLVQCQLDAGEVALPSGWKKMKHVSTGQILFINETEMKSQRTHPANAPKTTSTSEHGW